VSHEQTIYLSEPKVYHNSNRLMINLPQVNSMTASLRPSVFDSLKRIGLQEFFVRHGHAL